VESTRIGNAVIQHTLFNLDCAITLYDLTNTFFEGTGKKGTVSLFPGSGFAGEKANCPLFSRWFRLRRGRK